MLVVRREQYAALERAALRRVQAEMAEYGKQLSPDLCRVLGEQQLNIALRQAMERAAGYGFTNRGPIRLYVELMFFWGSDFDTDPMYPVVGELLRSTAFQMERAERIHEQYVYYLDRVCGPDNINVHKSWESLSRFLRDENIISVGNLDTSLMQEMTRAFPQRAAYLGNESLAALIRQAYADARTYGLSAPEAVVLLTTLKFIFGHGCAHDPLYPWISRTLTDKRIVDSAARAVRMKRKMISWLDRVLARLSQGPGT